MASSSSNKSSIRSVPIPSYAKEWGKNVKRPLEAPSDLDAGHIALQDIFLRATADGSEEFVVLEACNRCRALELKCDHSLRCSGCKDFGTSCARMDLSCRPLQAVLSATANRTSRDPAGSVPNSNVANGKAKGMGKARSTDVLQLAPPDVASYGKDRKPPLQLAPPGYRSPYYRPRPANPFPNAPPNSDTASTSKSSTPPSKRPITPKASSSNAAPQASASSDTVSPASSMEIPEYAKAWSAKVRRPEKLPINHDPHRIAPEDVFSIERSDGLTQLVVLQRCDRCRELRQHCNRAWPSCSRCKSSKLECSHSDMSYVPLPHGYVPRGVPSSGGSKADAKARAKASKESTASSSANDEPTEAQTPNADIVSTNKRRQPDDETKTVEGPGVVQTTWTSPPTQIEIPLNEDMETPNKRRKLDAEGTSGSKRKPVSSRPAKKSVTEPSVLYKWDRETTPKVNWTVPQHPPITSQLPKNADYRRQPMVWAGSLEEFTAVLPEFARLTNNVSLYSSVSPTVVLDEKSWPEDRWEGNVITINFVRQFSVPVSSDPRTAKMPDGLLVIDGKDSRVVEPNPPLKATPGVTAPSSDAKSDHPIKSETPNLGSLKDKQSPTPLKNGLESSKGKGPNEATPKFSSSNHTELASGASETSKPKHSPTLSNPVQETSKPEEPPVAASSHNEASGSLPPNGCLCSDYRYDPSCKRCHPQTSEAQNGSSGIPKSAGNGKAGSAAPSPPELKVDDPNTSSLPLPNDITEAKKPSAKLEIPEPYPEEIVALQYTFNNGIPMKLVASGFCPLLPVAFDSKIKFGFLGFFHITGAHVQVDSVKVVQHRGKPQKRGRVTWRFTFEWIPGGIPPLLSNLSGFNGDAPWWDMSQTEIFPKAMAFTKRPDRFYPDELGYCLVPEHVLSDCGRGWLHICGRLNVRGWRGSRRCDNCKMGYYAPGLVPIKEASEVRDSWRFSPLLDPETKCPNGLTETVSVWNTGMRTLRYSVAAGRPHEAIATHVFNCNLPTLEKDADIIFKKFQGVFMEVVLDRPRTRGIAPTPRYRYTVGIPKHSRPGQDSLVIDGPLKIQAGPAPDAITIFPATRDMMLSLAKTYVGGIPGHELPGLEINWIEATGWLEESKTKVPGIAHAADAPVLFLCLGADIELIFDWKLAKRVKASGPPVKAPVKRRGAADKATKANGTSKSGPGPQSAANSSVDGDGDTKMLLSGTADDGEANSDIDEDDGAGGDEDSGPPSKAKSSTAKDTLHIMMTHGDLVMVTGGDLHYAILPRGYCILLKTIG